MILALRPRVLARAADVVEFRPCNRAISSIVRGRRRKKETLEGVTVKSKDNRPSMVIALRRLGGKDLRVEVLNLVARRAGCWLKSSWQNLRARPMAKRNSRKARRAPVTVGQPLKSYPRDSRPQANCLNEGGDPERPEFATPGLNQVTASSISFLTNLRAKNPGSGRPEICNAHGSRRAGSFI